MIKKAMATGEDAVLSWFDSNLDETSPLFSVWNGSDILFSYCGTDAEKSRQVFTENLSAAVENGYDAILTLRLHYMDEKGINKFRYVNRMTPCFATFMFRPVALESGQILPYNRDTTNYVNGVNNNDRIAQLEERLAAYESEDQEEDLQPVTPLQDNSIAGILNTLLQEPMIKQIVVQKISGWLGVTTPAQTPQMAINGIPNDTQMTTEEHQVLPQAIEILKAHRPQIVADIINLANIAQSNPQKLQMILSFLPKE